jgi:homeobox protein cut-like
MVTFLRFMCAFYLQGSDPRHASADQDQSSMLKVICNQRDRFRARLRETEEVYLMNL